MSSAPQAQHLLQAGSGGGRLRCSSWRAAAAAAATMILRTRTARRRRTRQKHSSKRGNRSAALPSGRGWAQQRQPVLRSLLWSLECCTGEWPLSGGSGACAIYRGSCMGRGWVNCTPIAASLRVHGLQPPGARCCRSTQPCTRLALSRVQDQGGCYEGLDGGRLSAARCLCFWVMCYSPRVL